MLLLLLFAFPLLGLRVRLFTLWVPTLHTKGLQQPEVSIEQPASFRLRQVLCICNICIFLDPQTFAPSSRFFQILFNCFSWFFPLCRVLSFDFQFVDCIVFINLTKYARMRYFYLNENLVCLIQIKLIVSFLYFFLIFISYKKQFIINLYSGIPFTQ